MRVNSLSLGQKVGHCTIWFQQFYDKSLSQQNSLSNLCLLYELNSCATGVSTQTPLNHDLRSGGTVFEHNACVYDLWHKQLRLYFHISKPSSADGKCEQNETCRIYLYVYRPVAKRTSLSESHKRSQVPGCSSFPFHAPCSATVMLCLGFFISAKFVRYSREDKACLCCGFHLEGVSSRNATLLLVNVSLQSLFQSKVRTVQSVGMSLRPAPEWNSVKAQWQLTDKSVSRFQETGSLFL